MAWLEYGNLRIEYNAGGIDAKLDRALEAVLEKYGYKWWASGISHLGVRDMAFGKKGNEEG